MINQHKAGVTQVLVQGIAAPVQRLRKSLLSSRFSRANFKLDWDETEFVEDIDLEYDKAKLRDLEAEIYTLTDQLKTEQCRSGALLHER